MLYALYNNLETGNQERTFSNLYNVKKSVPTSSPAAAFDAFWANYDLDFINDDILSETV
jgi:hypothetical protein